MPEYVDISSNKEYIRIEDLTIPRALSFAKVMKNLPFIEFLAAQRSQGEPKIEIVVFEVEVERPQIMKYKIELRERLAAFFEEDDTTLPCVFALRADFPQVPHLNLYPSEYPRSLCLYEEDPRDVIMRWTPLLFIKRIREWLALTARGDLHHNDQPLEPFLQSSSGTIILSKEIYTCLTSSTNMPIFITRMSDDRDPQLMLVAKVERDKSLKPFFITIGVMCNTTTHGIIRRQPATLWQMAELMKEYHFDLLSELRSRLRERVDVKLFCDSRLILLIGFPKSRKDGTEAEETEVWVFACDTNLTNTGRDIGIWEVTNGNIGMLIKVDETLRGENVHIFPLKAVRSFTPEMAANLSGLTQPDEQRIVLIGVGALGSQIFLNSVRAGIGHWTIIDNDRLLPHNLARHALDGIAIGFFKAESMSFIANHMVDDGDISSAIIADVLSPGDKEQQVTEALASSRTIIDTSASISVARHLAIDTNSPARRISMFFTPSGKTSILLAEDAERRTTLDILEMQYYREIAASDHLSNHLAVTEQRIRYAQSCRDITSRVPQDIVTLHASLCSNTLKQVLSESEAFAGVWSIQSKWNDITFTPLTTSPLVEINSKDWRIRTDKIFLKKLENLRAEKLPNETGGVILGDYDMKRHIVYLIETIPSPPDSKEWPTVYIRGCKGLAAQLAKIESRTAGNLFYVGEWHSHPDGTTVLPSRDDITAFGLLRVEMLSAGLPPLMIIIGQNGITAIYIEVME